MGQDLLRQIDLPAEEYFPQDYREVRLATGQSLSSLSNIYLGSIYKFHALAKYNGIAEPRSMKVGQMIRIPLTTEAMAVFAAQKTQAQSIDSSPPREAAQVTEPAESGPQPEVGTAPYLESELDAELEDELDSEPEAGLADAPDVEQLHLQALNAYRAQDLARAIALWDEVLAVNPEHENARLYRAQALDLQQKLRDLK